jgi:hypothetical protein
VAKLCNGLAEYRSGERMSDVNPNVAQSKGARKAQDGLGRLVGGWARRPSAAILERLHGA